MLGKREGCHRSLVTWFKLMLEIAKAFDIAGFVLNFHDTVVRTPVLNTRNGVEHKGTETTNTDGGGRKANRQEQREELPESGPKIFVSYEIIQEKQAYQHRLAKDHSFTLYCLIWEICEGQKPSHLLGCNH